MKGWWKYAGVGFLVGAIACGVAVLGATHGAGAKLNADLTAARTAVADVTAINGKLTESNKILYGQLADSGRTIASQQSVIAGQQHTLADQQRILGAVAEEITGAGGDILTTSRSIAKGFAELYAGYHKGPS